MFHQLGFTTKWWYNTRYRSPYICDLRKILIMMLTQTIPKLDT